MSALVLHLRSPERVLFDRLSTELQNGWVVESEVQEDYDSPRKARIRMQLLRVTDPMLSDLPRQLEECASDAEVTQLLLGVASKNIDEADLAELFFLLGTHTLTELIEQMLHDASSDDQLQQVAHLTLLRHMLLSSAVRTNG